MLYKSDLIVEDVAENEHWRKAGCGRKIYVGLIHRARSEHVKMYEDHLGRDEKA